MNQETAFLHSSPLEDYYSCEWIKLGMRSIVQLLHLFDCLPAGTWHDLASLKVPDCCQKFVARLYRFCDNLSHLDSIAESF